MTPDNTPRLKTGWKRDKVSGHTGNGGEVGKYIIDKAHYEHCKLSPRIFIKKYFISKGESLRSLYPLNPSLRPLEFVEDAILYVVAANRDLLNDDDTPEDQLDLPYLALRTCVEGKHPWMSYVKTNDDAKRCGLSTILAYLCYHDREVEPSIMGTSITGYDFSLELETSGVLAKLSAKKLKYFAERKCQRILKVITVSDPSAGGRAYVNAGMDAGYQYLITFKKKNPLRKISVTKTAKLVEEFKKKEPYTAGNNLVDPVLDPFIANYGNEWYLCKKSSRAEGI